MPTVQQLARELGLTSQEVMARLKGAGRPAEGHLSEVDDQVAERLRRDSRSKPHEDGGPVDNPAAADETPAPKATTPKKTTAKKTTGKKTTAKTTAAKKTTAKKTTGKKTTAKKTTAKKTTAKKTTAKKTASKKTTSKKTTVRGAQEAAADPQTEAAAVGAPQPQPQAEHDQRVGTDAPPETTEEPGAPPKEKRKGLWSRFKRRAKPAPGEKDKPKPPKPKGSAKKKWLKRAAELPVLVLVAFLIAIVIKMFLVQAFFIPSGSMRPTLTGGDRVLVEKLSYLVGSPDQGDVIVFARAVAGEKEKKQAWYDDARNFMRDLLGMPTPGSEDYIKRVAAVGGDTFTYEGEPRVLTVNGKRIKEPYLKQPDTSSEEVTSDTCRDMELEPDGDGCRVPAGTVFVLGDNRSSSQDSRFLGPIKQEKIIGRAFVVIWPPGDFGSV